MLRLLAEEINALEQKIKQLGTVTFRHNVNGGIADDGEQILHAMCNRHQRVVFHHGAGAFNGVHDSENRVDIVLGKVVLVLCGKNKIVKLLQKGTGFKEVSLKKAVVVSAHDPSILLHNQHSYYYMSTKPAEKLRAAQNNSAFPTA